MQRKKLSLIAWFSVIAALLFLWLAVGARAQDSPSSRFVIGLDGGYAFNNTTIGIVAGAEIPVGRHFEVDSFGYFYPYESKAVYGSGYLYNMKAGPVVWINRTSGFEGLFEKGGYSVTKVSKGADYVFAGYVYKHMMLDFPTRFHFDYFQQVFNGIDHAGVETNHLTGGAFTFDTLLGCSKHFCVRSAFTWLTGRVLEQGNPYCDGTYSGCPNIIKRNSDIGGGFDWSLMFQFGGKKNDQELF